MGAYSDMHREDATRRWELHKRIDESGDVELMWLMEERDRLAMDDECDREIRGEWAAEARKLIDHFTPDAKHSCPCDICAVTHGLTAAVSVVDEFLAAKAVLGSLPHTQISDFSDEAELALRHYIEVTAAT